MDPVSWRLKWLAYSHGVLLSALVIGTQFMAVFPISSRYGPDASYEVFVATVARTAVIWFPLGTVAGLVIAWRCSSVEQWQRSLRWLWIASAILVAVLILLAFYEAAHSPDGRWWVQQH